MKVYRIANKKRANDLSGIGAKLVGGRWNPKGFSVLYTASNSSLAILEKLVHVDIDLLPTDLYITEINIDHTKFDKIEIKDLPFNWSEYPAPSYLKEIGKKWITKGEYLVLEVPSAVNPNESNYLINTEHKAIDKVKIGRIIPMDLDPRLGK